MLGALRGLPACIESDTDRRFLWIPVLVAAGSLIYFSLKVEPGWATVTGISLAAGCIAVAGFRRGQIGFALAMVLVAGGFALGKMRTESLMTPIVTRDSGVMDLSGWIESVEVKSVNRQRAVVRVTQMRPVPSAKAPRKLRISLSRKGGDLIVGHLVSFKVRLFKPKRPIAPGAFDFARRDWFLGIGGSGFAFGDIIMRDEPQTRPFDLTLRSHLSQVRMGIANLVNSHLSGEVAAFTVAVLTGMRGAISEATVENLRAAGLAHLLAISGLHMGLVAFTMFSLVRAFLALMPNVALRWPIKKWSAAVALAVGGCYLALSGAAVSTQRAYLMVGIMFLAVIVERPAISMRNVAIAAIVILVLRPESILSVSFQMSFLAVIGLVALYEFREPTSNGPVTGNRGGGESSRRLTRRVGLYFSGVVLTTVIAGLATAPVAAYHFNRIAVFGTLANLLAIPMMAMLIMPAALIGTLLMPVGLEAVPLTMAGWGVSAVLWAAESAARLPGALRHVSSVQSGILLLIILGMLWTCLWRSVWRWFGPVLVLVALSMTSLDRRPDVLIEQDAKAFAVRGPLGQLVPSSATSARFALERWLAADGDDAPLSEAVKRGGMSCDAQGCFAEVPGGLAVSFLETPAALWDACAKSDIVITAFSFRGACGRAKLVVDFFDLHAHGAHALYTRAGGIVVDRVADRIGVRPWTQPGAASD